MSTLAQTRKQRQFLMIFIGNVEISELLLHVLTLNLLLGTLKSKSGKLIKP